MLNDKIAKWVAGLLNHLTSPAESARASEKHVLLALLSYTNGHTKTCWPGIERLSRDTGYSSRTVRAALHSLSEMRYLDLARKSCRGDGNGRGRMANVYLVKVPDEFIPKIYRTNRQPLPEGHTGLTGNQGGPTGKYPPDQPATIAPQVIKEVINYQVSGFPEKPHDAPASTYGKNRKKVTKEATDLGISEERITNDLESMGLVVTQKAVSKVKNWQPAPADAEATLARAFESVLRVKRKNVKVPKDDGRLTAFAREHGVPHPDGKLGESTYDFRGRIYDHINSR